MEIYFRGNNLIPENEWIEFIDSLKASQKATRDELKNQILNAVKKRIPKKRFGIFFSGGVDSSLIALICKQAGADFICYTVGLENAADIEAGKKAAESIGVKLRYKVFSLEEAEKIIKETTKIVGPDVMKVGVGSVVIAAVKLAKQDNIDTFFSGLGSEELFAGYERHQKAKDINNECWLGLKSMYKRDLERDVEVAKALRINILTPFLDKDLIKAAMQIPGEEKLSRENNKLILRKIAEELGLPNEIAWRKKIAAQYGSKFDRAILRLSRRSKFRFKKDYLKQFYPLGALVSSGKDSIYAMHLMMKQYNVKCMMTMKSQNPVSYMFHTPAVEMVRLQAESIGLPLIEHQTKGEKEKELADLKTLMQKAKEKYNIQGVVTGALYSSYQKERVEKVAESLCLKVFSPLWHVNQEQYMREIIKEGFRFILTKVACEGLDKSWLNRQITERDVDKLAELNRKIGINVAGEGGEFESLMVAGPIFKKKIKITDSEIDEESRIIATLKVKKAELA